AAHGTHLREKDRQLLADSGAGVAHNPAANLKLASGIADVHDLRQRGVTVGIGTDGAASNNSLDLFEEAKFASLLQKKEDATRMPGQQVLDMMTIDLAKVLGLVNEIGSV
ncbi:MAG: amidohydrolase family protein, partial [Candidatus Nanohaloarchaea archaeon]